MFCFLAENPPFLCKSMLFPFQLRSYVDAFSPKEKPGKMTIVGAATEGAAKRSNIWDIINVWLSSRWDK